MGCLVRCESCDALALVDEDGSEGVMGGTLKFGPASALKSVALPEVLGYRIVFLDDCGTEMGEAHPFIPAVGYDPGCCRSDQHEAIMENLAIPMAGGGGPFVETVMIKVITEYGELPVGKKVYFKDRVGVDDTVKPLTAASPRRHGVPGG